MCLDAPSPPDYGGAIDMHFKIIELAKYRPVILHYFAYKDGRNASGLEKYCQAIHVYPRRGISALASVAPYIVSSRINKDLIERLNADDCPVLLEGIHCAGVLPHLDRSRRIVIRMHNDEAMYYRRLIGSEHNVAKKLYYLLEARRLTRYQHRLEKRIPLACVSHTDMAVLQEKYGFSNLHFIPSFTSWQRVQGREGCGRYCLYQGNLNVPENREAVRWLLTEVFSRIDLPFVVAGKGINAGLRHLATDRAQVSFVANPSDATMDELVRDAQVHVLPSLNSTGLKLKMLHALFLGRHCVTNEAGVAGTAFRDTVTIAGTADQYIDAITDLFNKPFTEADRDARAGIAEVYSNARNGAALNALL
ncbi:MAG: glycosyltransferase family 4 protein [Flaviaesturariibacter sp.]|nr:glycosyltransferase family 4 protein [Flaviaesturariibacter sp.]